VHAWRRAVALTQHDVDRLHVVIPDHAVHAVADRFQHVVGVRLLRRPDLAGERLRALAARPARRDRAHDVELEHAGDRERRMPRHRLVRGVRDEPLIGDRLRRREHARMPGDAADARPPLSLRLADVRQHQRERHAGNHRRPFEARRLASFWYDR
jgi:hypothetical protein